MLFSVSTQNIFFLDWSQCKSPHCNFSLMCHKVQQHRRVSTFTILLLHLTRLETRDYKTQLDNNRRQNKPGGVWDYWCVLMPQERTKKNIWGGITASSFIKGKCTARDAVEFVVVGEVVCLALLHVEVTLSRKLSSRWLLMYQYDRQYVRKHLPGTGLWDRGNLESTPGMFMCP